MSGRNGGGDTYFTDGEIALAEIDPKLELQNNPDGTRSHVVLPDQPSVSLKRRVWNAIVAFGRFVHWLPEPRKVARDEPDKHRWLGSGNRIAFRTMDFFAIARKPQPDI